MSAQNDDCALNGNPPDPTTKEKTGSKLSNSDDEQKVQHPLQKAGVFSQMFFIWMFSFFKTGNKRSLVEDDLYDVLPEDSSIVLVKILERKWNAELEKAKATGRGPSLRWAIFHTFGWRYMLYGCAGFFEEAIVRLSQPVMLSRLILYFSTDLVSTTEAYLQAAGITLSALLLLIFHHFCFFGFSRVAMRLRVACSSLIFRKAMKLSHVALGKTTIGQLVNILSNDVNKFHWSCTTAHYVWITPVQLLIVGVLLWREIGVSCLVGLSIFVLLAPLQVCIGRIFSKLRSKTALLTDSRIRIMNEVITGIRIIKIYAWEQSFGKLVSEARRKEIRKIMQAGCFRALPVSFVINAPLVATMTTFLVYASLGNPVSSIRVFPVLALFFTTRIGPSLLFPNGLMNGSEALVSIRRIQNFLLMEELATDPALDKRSDAATIPADERSDMELNETLMITDDHHVTFGGADDQSTMHNGIRNTSNDEESLTEGLESPKHSKPGLTGYLGPAAFDEEDKSDMLVPIDIDIPNEPGIVVRDLCGSWTKDVGNGVLQDISFRLEPGELLAVIGPVGCGKSSLLMAILGELPSLSGLNLLRGQVGYTAQQPWILSCSFRDNILFGSQYEPEKYQRVVQHCALVSDIELLPHGDQTLVGERGVTLSGGQRARVTLARAIYSDADVYLMDDILSAVDPGVGRHLFEQCILNYLGEKPRILVTHQLQFLDRADKILILDQGKVADYGTYRELQEHGVDFAKLLKIPTDETSDGNKSTTEGSSGTAYLEKDEAPKVIAPEEMADGTVSLRVYFRFFRAAAGWFFLIVWLVIFFGAQVLLARTDVWLTEWATEEDEYFSAQNITILMWSQDLNITTYENRSYYMRVYAVLSAVSFVLILVRAFLFFYVSINASKVLHNQMFHSIIRAPMRFFDTNPVGRVLNRFAKDIGFMDDVMPTTYADFLQLAIYAVSTVIVISIFNPICLVFTLPILLLFTMIRRYYLASSRAVRRLEGISRSPVFSHLSASLTGLSTIRAFGAQQRFTTLFDKYQDDHTKAWFLFLATSRWFGVQLDTLSVLFVCGVCFTSLLAADLFGLTSAIVGLSLTYALGLLGTFQWAVRQSAELENQMVSVERVCQYVDIQSEAPLDTDHKPSPDWPKDGMITLEGASLCYSDDGPLVLKDISCRIQSEEKVGIVGRTGAGKSSLMTILMRLAEPTGTIMIDGIDISMIGLHDLRKQISYIPQDPVLFSGTLRKNLDPFGEHACLEIWRALEQVEMKLAIEELPDKLEAILTEGGSNFSVGQRQLLCLARTILRKNKILIVDEATANVDIRTDQLIQATIREQFQHCTVLTVAHRLNTIIDSDRILVLDAGRLVEFDKPYALLQKDDCIFTKMVRETGEAEAASLHQIAQEKYNSCNSNPKRSSENSSSKPCEN